MRVGGLLWLAPICSSWVWLNVSMTKRSAENAYHGDPTCKPVQEGNLIATICAFLLELAIARMVQAALENPPRSYIWRFPPLASSLESLGMDLHAAICHRCAYEDAGKDSKLRLGKMYKVVATGDWIKGARRKCQCPGRVHMLLTKTWLKSGRKRCAGRRALLAQSAAYPRGFGKVIIQVWQQGMTQMEVPSPDATVLEPKTKTASSLWHKPSVGALGAPLYRVRSPKATVLESGSSQGSSWMKPALGPSPPARKGPKPIDSTSWLKPIREEDCDRSWMKPAL